MDNERQTHSSKLPSLNYQNRQNKWLTRRLSGKPGRNFTLPLRRTRKRSEDNMRTDQVIQIGNLIPNSRFSNPQRGRVYSVYGIAPGLNGMDSGNNQPKVLIKYDRRRIDSDTKESTTENIGVLQARQNALPDTNNQI